jgi:integrase
MRIYKVNKVYYIDYTDSAGKRVRESTGTTIKKVADEIAAKISMDLRDQKFGFKKAISEITFDDFRTTFEEYCESTKKENTAKFHKNSLKNLDESFNGFLLSEITVAEIEKYKLRRLKNVSRATVNRELATLSHLFNYAIMMENAVENPVEKIKKLKEPAGRLRYLSMEEMQALLEECRRIPYLYVIVLIALNTGMRRGEILNLRRRDIDLENKYISIPDSKSGKRRDIYINDFLHGELSAWLENLKGEKVFPVEDFKKSFRSACNRAGIMDFRFHDIRHTFASHLVMEGIDLTTVKELMGHSNVQMTTRYSHLSPGHKRDAVNCLANKYSSNVKMKTEN